MTEFEFRLFCRSVNTADEAFLDRLYEGGCGDATVFFKDGYACLEFARRAASAEHAILSAIADFERAASGACIERVEPEDLASLSEIARRVGVTRASLQKYARGDSKVGQDFPAPVQNLSLPRRELFSTAQVMEWMRRKRRAAVPTDTLDLFRAVAEINRALEMRRAADDARIGRIFESLNAPDRRRGLANG